MPLLFGEVTNSWGLCQRCDQLPIVNTLTMGWHHAHQRVIWRTVFSLFGLQTDVYYVGFSRHRHFSFGKDKASFPRLHFWTNSLLPRLPLLPVSQLYMSITKVNAYKKVHWSGVPCLYFFCIANIQYIIPITIYNSW